MRHFFEALVDPASFTPHGFCLLWDPGLLWLHGVSDTVIGLSYFSIPLVLLQFARRRQDLEYRWVLWLFALFILACGTTHFLAVATLWVPLYWLDGTVKAITAIASVATAALLWPLLPRLLELPSPSALRLANEQLSWQMQERERHIAALQERDTQMRHLQRMEALGKLSAGIAHDFNNVLQAVGGGLRMINRRADNAAMVREVAEMTSSAVARGAAIAGRLLSLGRKAELQAEPLPPDMLLNGLSNILQPALGPNIELHIRIDPATPPLLADRAQLETMLLNLSYNARDAMRDGGTLTLAAHRTPIPDGPDAPKGLPAGLYVTLTLTDTGHGIPEDILARVGEPFFTTKPVGEGTGLGIAMARGFAEQSGGALAIASRPGEGTTVTLWFPAAAQAGPGGAGEVDQTAAPPPAPPQHDSHIVMVDDDAMVGKLLAYEMKDFGYRITSLSNAAAALAYLGENPLPDLVVTDYAMPGMNGLQLIELLAVRYPRLPIVLLTGFAEPAVLKSIESIASPLIAVVRKPVSGEMLASRIEKLLVNS